MSVQTFITVSSRNRIVGSASNFVTRVQRQFLGQDPHTIKLITASIPLTFHSVPAGRNTIYIDGSAYNITPGKYSGSSLCSELSRLFVVHNALDASTFTVSAATGKLQIVPSDNYTLNASNADFTALSILGLTATDKALTTSNLFTGENLVNLAGVDAFYIRLPGLVQNSYADFPGQPNDFITVVDVTENHLNYAIQKYLPNQSPHLLLTAKVVHEIRVIITDQNNEEVNLNGAETSFTFVLEKVPIV